MVELTEISGYRMLHKYVLTYVSLGFVKYSDVYRLFVCLVFVLFVCCCCCFVCLFCFVLFFNFLLCMCIQAISI